MFLLTPVFAFLLSSLTQPTHAQTLYEPGFYGTGEFESQYPSATVFEVVANYTISAVGVGPNSWTTYVEKGVQTVVQVVGSSTFAVVSTAAAIAPTAYTETFEENESGWRFSDGTSGDAATCVFNTDGGASCKGHGTSYTQVLNPLYTLGEPALAAAPTQTANAAGSVGPRETALWVVGVVLVQALYFGALL